MKHELLWVTQKNTWRMNFFGFFAKGIVKDEDLVDLYWKYGEMEICGFLLRGVWKMKNLLIFIR